MGQGPPTGFSAVSPRSKRPVFNHHLNGLWAFEVCVKQGSEHFTESGMAWGDGQAKEAGKHITPFK